MSELSKRSTVYFEEGVHQALRVKAATTHRSVSEVVNEAVRLALREDQEDLSAFTQWHSHIILYMNVVLNILMTHK